MAMNLLFIALSVSSLASLSSSQACRSVPGTAGWPTSDQWAAFNQSIDGRLLAPNPPAIVCDPSRQATYNSAACAAVGAAWDTPLLHTNDPVSVHYPNWQDDACLPTAVYNATTPSCDTTPFPFYVVNATSSDHIATALQFANSQGVRVSVKGSGHDFLGRSTSPGLGIWTRNIRGINFLNSFTPTNCTGAGCTGTTAVQVSAGDIFGTVYQQAATHGVIAVLGDDGSVSPGGYLLGGGHSPISTKFGLAGDNVLEMTAVVPSGDLITANAYQNQDLFFALRGGGLTFAVLITATLQTYPDFDSPTFQVSFTSTKAGVKNNNVGYFSALADFHLQIPHMTDNNLTGYNFARPTGISNIGEQEEDQNALISGPQTFIHEGHGLDLTQAQTKAVLLPLIQLLNATKGIKYSVQVGPPKSFYGVGGSVARRATAGTAGIGTDTTSGHYPPGINRAIGSRLWDLPALSNKKKLVSTFRKMQPALISGLMISGPAVRNAPNQASLSVTPAWRTSYYHIASEAVWAYKNTTAQDEGTQRNNVLTSFLRQHAPNMGCYVNEADAEEPDFQQAFWGSNYPRLLQLKHQYDPNGVFYCNACVGSEEWVEEASGALCPVANS